MEIKPWHIIPVPRFLSNCLNYCWIVPISIIHFLQQVVPVVCFNYELVVFQTSNWQTWHYCIALDPGLTWLHLGRLEHRVETQGQPGSEYCLARKNEANNCHIFSCKQSSLDILQNVTLRTRVHNRLGQTTGQGTVEVLKVTVVVKPG